MAEMTDLRGRFPHELGDIPDAERVLMKALPKLQKEASDNERATGFREHLSETEQQIANLEEEFKALRAC